MTTQPLSPAAQAVWDAWNDAYEAQGPLEDMGYPLAAGLVAAADQVARMDPLGDDIEDLFRGAEREHMRGKLHTLAAELRQEVQP
jgi:hypothetical protein